MHTITPETPDKLLARPATRGLQDVRDLESSRLALLADCSSTYALIQRGAARNPESPALSFFLHADDFHRPLVWTHREWVARITQTANMLRRHGLCRQDTVAYVLPNLPETHWVIWGGETAGRVLALNPQLEPAMLRELMQAVKPRLLVTLAPTLGTDLWEKISGVATEVHGLQAVFTVSPMRYHQKPAGDAAQVLQTPQHVGHIPVLDLHQELEHVPEDHLEFEAPTLDDVASYFCTGGTTGMPKIAVRTHRTEVANALQVGAMFGDLGTEQPLFCGLPLFHVNAQIATGLMPWSRGGHVVLGTSQGYRAPGLMQQFWKIAAHYRLFSFSGVPTIFAALLQSPREGLDLGSLKFGLCGAAPMPFELISRFQRETGIRILEGYGLTEGGCVSTLNPPGGSPRPGSIGIRLPWQDLRVVVLKDGSYLREAATGEAGTITITGPNLFEGYLNDAHNRGLWIQMPDSPSRWLNTGDLGRVDAEGYVWLTGRSKELIIRGGHNIDPKMIEEPMHEHPCVAMAAAIGRPDAHAGEVPVVYVQLRPGAACTAGGLLEWARERIAERAAWPKHVVVWPALPTTAIGKLFKPALVEMEVRFVVFEEAQAADAPLTVCEVLRDPLNGLVVRWRAQRNEEALAERLARFAFHTERA